MAARKTVFVCQQCGAETAKWMGKCPNCDAWNSIVETARFSSKTTKSGGKREKPKKPSKLKDIKGNTNSRVKTNIKELDKSLSGGIVDGQVILIAGEPGIGKSTLLLQVAKTLNNTLYVSGEESLSQIKIRTERLGLKAANFECLSETNIDNILNIVDVENAQCKGLIIDSVQTMYTDDLSGIPGSVSQVREVCLRLIRYAKKNGVPVILVGHVTKEGSVAGPATLMHMVDTVLWFEGEKKDDFRILRVMKNRFGPTDEIALFSMTSEGLKGVSDISDFFFAKDRAGNVAGSIASCIVEGSRTILVEVQSLVIPSRLAIPRRVVQGVDPKRVELIIAVLTRHCGLNLIERDVFVNVVGGIKVRDPGIDLAVALSLVSSLKNKPIKDDLAAIGEVGLLGDVRQTSQHKKVLKHIGTRGLKAVGPENKQICDIIHKIFGARTSSKT